MIQYRITRENLEKEIEVQAPGWLAKAQTRTERFRRLGYYKETSSIWSEVKAVYMRLQGNSKCAYCERKLESIDYGKGEQDVEHFRPKSSVRAWKAPKSLTDQRVTFTEVPSASYGYYLLPYHLLNYSAACKPCNSALKKDYFPIASAYNLRGEEPEDLLREKPYLMYPIGRFDDDPQDLLEFYGTSPRPRKKAGHNRRRALVTIEFFKLDDAVKRKNLFRERAQILVALFPQLEKIQTARSTAARTAAKKLIDGFTSPVAPHTNCARSFTRLFESDPAEARTVFDKASEFVLSIS